MEDERPPNGERETRKINTVLEFIEDQLRKLRDAYGIEYTLFYKFDSLNTEGKGLEDNTALIFSRRFSQQAMYQNLTILQDIKNYHDKIQEKIRSKDFVVLECIETYGSPYVHKGCYYQMGKMDFSMGFVSFLLDDIITEQPIEGIYDHSMFRVCVEGKEGLN